jgi:hypothetical protein
LSALAVEGGGLKVRLYKAQASPATIAIGGPMGCNSRSRARAKPFVGRYITHSKFKRANFQAKILYMVQAGEPMTVKEMGAGGL